jgi:hypothetical protein
MRWHALGSSQTGPMGEWGMRCPSRPRPHISSHSSGYIRCQREGLTGRWMDSHAVCDCTLRRWTYQGRPSANTAEHGSACTQSTRRRPRCTGLALAANGTGGGGRGREGSRMGGCSRDSAGNRMHAAGKISAAPLPVLAMLRSTNGDVAPAETRSEAPRPVYSCTVRRDTRARVSSRAWKTSESCLPVLRTMDPLGPEAGPGSPPDSCVVRRGHPGGWCTARRLEPVWARRSCTL